MSAEMAEAIRQLVQEKGIDEDLVFRMIEDTLKAAYKRKFGANDNAVVTFNEQHTDVSIYSRKTIVDGVYNPVVEIELEEALELDPECEIGDELLIEVDPKEFDRISVQSAKQTAHAPQASRLVLPFSRPQAALSSRSQSCTWECPILRSWTSRPS